MGGNAARWSKDHRAARCYFAFRCLRGVHRAAALPSFGDKVTLPRRCLHGVHRLHMSGKLLVACLCLGAACTGCIFNELGDSGSSIGFASALPARGASRYHRLSDCKISVLPRRCLHGVHRGSCKQHGRYRRVLPRRCLHGVHLCLYFPLFQDCGFCLGAACTGCIIQIIGRKNQQRRFASALPARGASAVVNNMAVTVDFASALPARGASFAR